MPDAMIPNSNTIYFASNVGNSRQNQEDNAILPNGSYLTPDVVQSISAQRRTYEKTYARSYEKGFLVAVSDGMGGHASGEVASGQTVRYLSENYQRIIDGAYLNKESVVDEISRLNRSVVSLSKSDPNLRGMGATLCGVLCSNGVCYGINVGDSRLYSYQNGKFEQLSTDHTEGQRLLSLKLLTEEEYQRFPRKKNLYKYIGMNGEVVADVFKIESCEPGTVLVLCSDGLADVISNEEISEILSTNEPIENKGHKLVEQAVARNVGHGDNITLILIEF